MSDDDIRAFRPEPTTPPPRTSPAPPPPTSATIAAVRHGRRWWPWLLSGLLVLTLLAAGALAALWTVADSAHHGWHIAVNGQPWDGWNGATDEIGVGKLLVAGVGVLVAVLLVMLVLLAVPFTVLLGLLLGLMGVAIGLAVTVGTVGLLAVVLLSPLWGLGLLLWMVFRQRSPPHAAAPAAHAPVASAAPDVSAPPVGRMSA